MDGWTRMGITSHFWMAYPGYPEEGTFEGKSLTFEVACPPLRQGDNAIGVSLVPSDGSAGSAATLTNVELDVAYKQGRVSNPVVASLPFSTIMLNH